MGLKLLWPGFGLIFDCGGSFLIVLYRGFVMLTTDSLRTPFYGDF